MTDQNTSETAPEAEAGGGDLFNTAAGWVLFAGVVGLGLSVLSDKYFHGFDPERPEQLGYVIEGVVEDAGPAAEMTIAEALTLVSATDGEKVYAKCSACHTITPGGANGVGPNLNGIMGASMAAKDGFAYSSGLTAKGGQWGWEEMNEWLKSPKSYVEGTKMSFAGLSKIEDRAAVMLFMNGPDGTLALPEFTPAAEEAASEEVAEREGEAAADDVALAEAEQNVAEGTSEETAEAEAAE